MYLTLSIYVQRALATTIGALSNPFGCILGFMLGSLYVSDADKDNIP